MDTLQFKRGTEIANNNFTGRAGDITIDTTNNALRIHDGVTKGGKVLSGGGQGENLLVWDQAVTDNLGTHNELSGVDVSIQARSAFGDSSLQYTVVSGSLPPGVSINTADQTNVTLSGTIPQHVASKVYSFRIQAYDGFNTIERDFTLNVDADNDAPVWQTAANLGVVVDSTSIQLQATDPEGETLTFHLVSGTLPTGLSLSSGGLLSGTAVPDGQSYSFTVAVSDGTNDVNRTFSALTGQDSTGSPGPAALQAGDMQLGFFGEITTSELITGDALASAIGLSSGTAQFGTAPWLKYAFEGQVKFAASKAFRYGLSWDQINAAGAVFGSAQTVIAGIDYRSELMRGANADPSHDSTGYDVAASHNSEWNQLFYRLHDGNHTEASNTRDSERPFDQWGQYSDQDLHMHYSHGNGTYCWTQETHGGNSSYRVGRGNFGVSPLGRGSSSSTNSDYGWRPVLVPVNQ